MEQVNQRSAQQREIVFAECELMLAEGIEIEKVTGRKVAKRKDVEWSHTTVTPFVLAWRELHAAKEREAIMQTQMSPNFVKALIKEVEERITSLRSIDENELANINSEVLDALENNAQLESQLIDVKKALAEKTEELTEASTLNREYKTEISKLKAEIDSAQNAADERYNHDIAELRSALEKAEKKHEANIDKLTNKNEQLHSELNVKTDECAQAKVKAGRFDETEIAYKQLQEENIELSKQVTSLQFDVKSKLVTIEANRSQIEDCIAQRNLAQNTRTKLEDDLAAITEERNTLKLQLAQNISKAVQEA